MHERSLKKIMAKLALQIINASLLFYTWQDVEFKIHFHFTVIFYFQSYQPCSFKLTKISRNLQAHLVAFVYLLFIDFMSVYAQIRSNSLVRSLQV